MLTQAHELLSAWAQAERTPETHRLDLVIGADALIDAVRALKTVRSLYLSAITGTDTGSGLEILYHFCAGAEVLTLRVGLPYDTPRIPSLCGVMPVARLYEIELKEMLGVDVLGLNAHDRLFLPDDWPQGLFPLRKDAALDTLNDKESD